MVENQSAEPDDKKEMIIDSRQMSSEDIIINNEMIENYKNKPGCSVALIYLLSYGLYGLFIAIGLVFTLSYEWAKVPGANLDDVPAGIMAAGSIGGIIAFIVFTIAGPIICTYRAKKWNRKAVILSGILGPVIGITGGTLGLLTKNPILFFVLLVAGMPLGVNLGKKLAERKG